MILENTFFARLNDFVYLYPLLMTIVWIVGGVIFYLRRERGIESAPELDEYPFFSILVPCHNEESMIENTVNRLTEMRYPDYEIIAIDDGSTDKTLSVLKELAKKIKNFRVITLTENQGKAVALNVGSLAAKGDLILSLDADTLLSRDALKWMAWHFVKFPRVGAVTGNPRVLNRSSLLAKIQVGEYATIIGLIKRTQRLLGKILTVSGVIAAFRKQALFSVGFWDNDMVTEDIDITWKLEKKFWDIRFEPKALCWVLVPETLRGLWIQRVRWAQGGVEVLIKHRGVFTSWKQRRIWPVYFEYGLSIFWAYMFLFLILVWILQHLGLFGFWVNVPPPIPPKWTGSILAMVCLLQFFVSLIIEKQYEKSIFRYYFWIIWYPFCYWLISIFTLAYAFPKAIFKPRGKRAVWKSPDRGLQDERKPA
ncbi:MAG: poly-beta-1,6 N-acetyl-D-glucosamine synthase [Deltaproteobacteria bacterium]|nr:poly-beta-1,6 N-acetyl-D-glucosamine synthase [Deltaproteobacteria bacterium]